MLMALSFISYREEDTLEMKRSSKGHMSPSSYGVGLGVHGKGGLFPVLRVYIRVASLHTCCESTYVLRVYIRECSKCASAIGGRMLSHMRSPYKKKVMDPLTQDACRD
jgi:hypothetical protein